MDTSSPITFNLTESRPFVVRFVFGFLTRPPASARNLVGLAEDEKNKAWYLWPDTQVTSLSNRFSRFRGIRDYR